MKKAQPFLLLLLCTVFLSGCATKKVAYSPRAEISDIKGFPSAEDGYALGVSACFAGCIGDNLIMAGGCNFPEPGKKRYYQGIYSADIRNDNLDWKLIGYLQEPVAYGVSIASGDSLIFLGGNNTEHSLSIVYSVHINEGKAIVKQLPSLPFTVDNMAGALSGEKVYIFGGNQNGKPSTALWKYDLNNGTCTLAGDIPGKPRVQPVCAAVDGKLYIWSGFFADGENSVVHTDGYYFDTNIQCWTVLTSPTLPLSRGSKEGVSLSGGTAIAVGSDIICLGGVNKDIFLDAISGRYTLVKKEDYLKKDPEWYRFNPDMFVFDTKKKEWREVPLHSQKLARAGAIIVSCGDSTLLYYIGGETKPSVRTNIIEKITIH